MDIPQRSVLDALAQWRQALLDAGVPAGSLPLESDLELIAGNPKAENFNALGLVRLDAVRKFQPGILSTVRTAARAAAVDATAEKPAEPPAREPKPIDEPPSRRPSDAPSENTPSRVAFTPRDPTAPADEPLRPMRSLQLDHDGRLVIRWDPVDTGATRVLYRVVTSERFMPTAPEMGEVQTVTTGTEFVDPRPITGALRYVQVWANRGPSETAARLAQPILLSQGIAVVPVTNVDLREDQGWVSCAWDQVPAGIDRVEVLRVPVADAELPGYRPQYLITDRDDCRTGFQDSTCEPGETYEYRIFTVATVNGMETMTGVTRRITISAPLHSVDDLHVDTRSVDERTIVDLTWAVVGNAHTVEIFRTEHGPEPGVEDTTIPATALASAGLPAEARLNQPIHLADGRARMTGVAWPETWDRVYFTPVTMNHDQVRVGSPRVLTRAGEIHDVRLFQRVDWQLLTLSWPTSASQVQVFVTRHGVPLTDPPGEPVAQLTRTAYDKDGGLRLRGVLPDGGCDVHVVPVAFYGGQIYRGHGATIGYDGITRLRYRLGAESGVKDRLFGGKGRRVLEVCSDQLESVPRLVLVHNEHRFPLDVRDGRPQSYEPTPVDKGRWTTIARLQCDPDKPGFFRLFADVSPDVAGLFAVLDPPLSTLRGGVA